MRIGAARKGAAPEVQRDAGVTLLPVPVTVVPAELAQRFRDPFLRRLDLLQAQHVRLLALDELRDFSLAGANAVDIPCGDREHPRDASASSDAVPTERGRLRPYAGASSTL